MWFGRLKEKSGLNPFEVREVLQVKRETCLAGKTMEGGCYLSRLDDYVVFGCAIPKMAGFIFTGTGNRG